MQSTVSVILPYYNAGNTLSESISSILDQSFEDFELILINNNSKDKSREIALHFAGIDKRITLIDEPRQGIVHALNAGIEYSSASYIARMDADDIALPHRLKQQVKFLNENPETDVIACCAKYVGESRGPYSFEEYTLWNNRLITHNDIYLNQFVESPVIHPSVMFRKELFQKYGLYRSGFFPEDYELWLRLLCNGVRFHKLNDILLEWRDSEKRLTRTDERYSTNSFYEVKSSYLFDWLKKNNPYFPKVAVWGAGRTSRQKFAYLHDLGIAPKFFIDLRANPDRNVIEFKHTPPAGKHFILSYVTNREAREKIREFLVEIGYSEGKDFLCVS